MSETIIFLEALFLLSGVKYLIHRKYSYYEVFVVFAIFLSVLSQLFFEGSERNIGIKITLFILCIVAAKVNPNAACLLLLGSVIIQTINNYNNNVFDSKYGVLSFGLFATAAYLFLIEKNFYKFNLAKYGLVIINTAFFIQLLLSNYYSLRSGIIISIISILCLNSNKVSKFLIDNIKYFPFLYYLFSILVYFFLLNGYESSVIDFSDSNIERSSMNIVVIKNLFNYPLYGPGIIYDSLLANEMWIFGKAPYIVDGGVDPHSFLFSVWRDLGTLMLLIFSVIWFMFWNNLKKYLVRTNSIVFRIICALLIIGVIQFSVYPPAAIFQFQVALIFGISLFFSQKPLHSK